MPRTAKPAALVAAVAALAASACAATPTLAPSEAPAGQFALDPTHASVTWRVAHAGGLSMFTGRFDGLAGTLDFDPENPEAARLSITIDAASVSTGLPDFDAKLAEADNVFDADAHPEIRFEATAIAVDGPASGRVTGNLTLRGQTRPLTLDVAFNGGAFDPLRRAQAVGFSAKAVLDRREWGADAWTRFGVGAEVELLIEAEFVET